MTGRRFLRVFNSVRIVGAEVRIGDLSEITDENGECLFLDVPFSTTESTTRFPGPPVLAETVALDLVAG